MKDDDLVRRSIREKIAQDSGEEPTRRSRATTIYSILALLGLLLLVVAGVPIPPDVALGGVVLLLFLAGQAGLDNWVKQRFNSNDGRTGGKASSSPGKLGFSVPGPSLIGMWLALLIYAFFRSEGAASYALIAFVAAWAFIRIFYWRSLMRSARRSKQRQFDKLFSLRKVKDPATIDYLAAVGTAQEPIAAQALIMAERYAAVKKSATGQDGAGGEEAGGSDEELPVRSQAVKLIQAMRWLRTASFQADNSVSQEIDKVSPLPVPETHTEFHNLWMEGARNVLGGIREFRIAVDTFERDTANIPDEQETLSFDGKLFEGADNRIVHGLAQFDEASAMQREMAGAGSRAEKSRQPV